MNYASGDDLLPPEAVRARRLETLFQIALLCRTALRRVVVYKDPKPENLLLVADLNIYLQGCRLWLQQ